MTEPDFDWGWLDANTDYARHHKMHIRSEVFVRNMYEKLMEVEKGDLVVDIGASVGPFTYMIIDHEPSSVYCFEPSAEAFPILQKNTAHGPVTCINAGISAVDGEDIIDSVFTANSSLTTTCKSMKFKTFIKKYEIEKIDFLKTDCEGGEYDIFNIENFSWIHENVKKIVGEWHLSTPKLKYKFIKFRDLYLRSFEDYEVHSVNGVNITPHIWTDEFVNYYSEIIIHINNQKSKL